MATATFIFGMLATILPRLSQADSENWPVPECAGQCLWDAQYLMECASLDDGPCVCSYQYYSLAQPCWALACQGDNITSAQNAYSTDCSPYLISGSLLTYLTRLEGTVDPQASTIAFLPTTDSDGSVTSLPTVYRTLPYGTGIGSTPTTTTTTSTTTLTNTSTSTAPSSTILAVSLTSIATALPTATEAASSGLSSGAAAGIGVGVSLGVVAAVAVAIWLFWRRRKQRQQSPDEPAHSSDEQTEAEKPVAPYTGQNELEGSQAPSSPLVRSEMYVSPQGHKRSPSDQSAELPGSMSSPAAELETRPWSIVSSQEGSQLSGETATRPWRVSSASQPEEEVSEPHGVAMLPHNIGSRFEPVPEQGENEAVAHQDGRQVQ
jgi:hypothetical protein